MAISITNTGGDIAGAAASGNVASYAGVGIGAAAADRTVVVCIGTELTSSVPTAVTIDYGTGALSMSAALSATIGAINSHIFTLSAPTGTTATIAVTFGGTNPTGAQNKIAVFRVTGVFEVPGIGSVADTDADPISSGAITIPTGGGCIAICADAADATARTWTGITEDLDLDAGDFRFSTGISTTAGTPTITVSGGNGEDGAISWVIFGTAPSMDAFRFYANGTEAGSVAIAAQGTDIERNGDTFDDGQLRVRIQNTGLAGASTDDWELQYSKNGGAYQAVTGNIFAFSGVGGLTDAAATTNRLTGGTGSFVAGKQVALDAIGDNIPITAGNFTELVFGFMIDPTIGTGVAEDDAFDFRVLYNSKLITYNVVPTVTTRKQGLSQDAFRFYNDDEVSFGDNDSTPIAAQNTNITHNTTSTPNFHLRFRIQENNNFDSGTVVLKALALQVSKNGGAYHAPLSSEFTMTGTGSTLEDGGATTNRLGAGAGSFYAGTQSETFSGASGREYHPADYTEHVLALTAQADAKVNDVTWDFRLESNDTTIFIVIFNQTPRLTVTGGSVATAPFSQTDWPLPTQSRRANQLRTWTQSLIQTTLTLSTPHPPFKRHFDLPPRAADRYPRSLRTWTSKYLDTLIGQDQLPPGTHHYERPPPITWYRSLTLNLLQSTLEPEEARPFVQTDWPLPTAYEFNAQLRTWLGSYNLNLISQDQLPVGVSHTDRPFGITWYRSWTINLLQSTLAPSDERPFNQFDWPVPRSRPRPSVSFVTSYNPNLVGQDQLPIGSHLIDRPTGVTWYRSWILNLLQSTLTPEEAQPFNQFDWPIPRRSPRPQVGFTTSYNPNLVGQDQLPIGSHLIDRPVGATWYRSWTLNLLQGTLTPEEAQPFNQFDWPTPRGYPRPQVGFTASYNLNLIGQDQLPVGTHHTDFPRGYPRPLVGFASSYNPNLIGQDQLPVGTHYTDRPPVPPWYRTWMLNLLQGTLTPEQFPRPFNQFDWPVPRGHPRPLYSFVAFYNPNLVGMDRLPVGSQITQRPPRDDRQSSYRSWIGFTSLAQNPSLGRPIGTRLSDLPPRPKPMLPPSITAFYNRNLIGQDAFPVGTQLTDRQIYAMIRNISGVQGRTLYMGQPVNVNSFFIVM